eukprot:scaffold19235_cov126-Isochrysis_galbana.AAC.11
MSKKIHAFSHSHTPEERRNNKINKPSTAQARPGHRCRWRRRVCAWGGIVSHGDGGARRGASASAAQRLFRQQAQFLKEEYTFQFLTHSIVQYSQI